MNVDKGLLPPAQAVSPLGTGLDQCAGVITTRVHDGPAAGEEPVLKFGHKAASPWFCGT